MIAGEWLMLTPTVMALIACLALLAAILWGWDFKK